MIWQCGPSGGPVFLHPQLTPQAARYCTKDGGISSPLSPACSFFVFSGAGGDHIPIPILIPIPMPIPISTTDINHPYLH